MLEPNHFDQSLFSCIMQNDYTPILGISIKILLVAQKVKLADQDCVAVRVRQLSNRTDI